MKTVCTILILLLFLHLQCGGSCLAETFRLGVMTQEAAGAQPPCPQHSQTPTNDPQSSHHAEGTCAQGPLIEGKLTICKVVLQADAILPDAIETSQPNDFEMRLYTPAHPRILLSPPTGISVLRI